MIQHSEERCTVYVADRRWLLESCGVKIHAGYNGRGRPMWSLQIQWEQHPDVFDRGRTFGATAYVFCQSLASCKFQRINLVFVGG